MPIRRTIGTLGALGRAPRPAAPPRPPPNAAPAGRGRRPSRRSTRPTWAPGSTRQKARRSGALHPLSCAPSPLGAGASHMNTCCNDVSNLSCHKSVVRAGREWCRFVGREGVPPDQHGFRTASDGLPAGGPCPFEPWESSLALMSSIGRVHAHGHSEAPRTLDEPGGRRGAELRSSGHGPGPNPGAPACSPQEPAEHDGEGPQETQGL